MTGSDAYVALTREGDDVIAYVCDGKRVWQWFRGSVTDGRVALTNSVGATLSATLDATGMSGDLRIGDEAFSFSAEPSTRLRASTGPRAPSTG